MSPDPGPGRNIGLKPLKRRARGSAPCPSRVYRRPDRLGRAAFGLAAERERLGRRRGPPPRGSQADSIQRQSGLAPSVRERLGQEKPALTQALRVDPMADAERQMPLGRDRRAGERFRRHEHGVKRDHLILIAVDEQNRRRRAARIARRRFAEMLGADK